MSKQDVIDYVMETPHNTNRAVLEGLVDTAVEESQVQADWSVNNENDPSYVKNRIGYYAEKEAAKNESTITVASEDSLAKTYYLSLSDAIKFSDIFNGITNKTCNVYLHYKEKRYPLSWDTAHGGSYTSGLVEIKDKLTIRIIISSNSYGENIEVSFLNAGSIDCVILPGEVYLTITYPVEISSDLLPLPDPGKTGLFARGAVSVNRHFNLNDQSGMSDDDKKWYPSDGTAIDTDGLLRIRRNIAGGNKSVLNKDTLSGSLASNDGQTMIFGSADDTVATLGLTEINFPVVITRINIIYDNMPTWTYMISTADGKKGRFTYKPTGVLSPITWTFEGGGNSTFDIVLKFDDSINEYTPTQTWNEIKTALTKSDRYEDYALLVDGVYIGIERFRISRNNKGEVDGLSITATNAYNFHNITDYNNNSIITDYTILSIDYEVHATKNKVTSKENLVAFQYDLQIWIDRDDTGALVCFPENAVAYLLSNAVDNASITAVSNEGRYSFEGAEADSNATGKIPNVVYFSTTANGIYKRLKITQGQNGAADTVVMDKEIKLNDEPLIITLSNDRGKLYTNFNAETIFNAAASGRRVLTNNGTVLVDYYIGGTANDKKYWILFAGSSNAPTASNGFVATEMYCNNVAGSFIGPWDQHYVSDLTNPLGLRNSQVGQIAEISGVDSNGKPTSWKTVDVLTTTNTAAFTPTADYHPATKKYVDDHAPSKTSELENDSNYITAAHIYNGILISSSTPNSTKKFKITVDDTGALTATEVTEA